MCSRSRLGEWGDGFAHLCEQRFSINPQGEHAADGPAVHVQIVTKSAGGEHFQIVTQKQCGTLVFKLLQKNAGEARTHSAKDT